VTYLTRQYGSNQRWLLKALREVPHELDRLVDELDRSAAAWRPAPHEWGAADVLGFLRESEREDLRAVRAMAARDGAAITERRAHLAPGERDFTREVPHELWGEFLELRERLLWAVEIAEDAWEHRGLPPHRDAVTLRGYLHEINERDLEAAWTLRRLAEQRPARSGGRRGRR
jgi:hypothetical protein